jgi:hypothetical protein
MGQHTPLVVTDAMQMAGKLWCESADASAACHPGFLY